MAMEFSEIKDNFLKAQEMQQKETVEQAKPASAPAAGRIPGKINFDDELGLDNVEDTLIQIIGCGGGGSNAVQTMIDDGVTDVQFVAINTDIQALRSSTADIRVPIGKKLTGGRGAGGIPEVGEQCANEDTEKIKMVLEDANMVIITAGMGGGTGTGSAPVVAKLAKEMGKLTIGVVTTPFSFEGETKYSYAEEGIRKLRQHLDCLIVLPNDLIFNAVQKRSPETRLNFDDQFKIADSVLCSGARGITELITKTGNLNMDFEDVKNVMRNSGEAILGVGFGKGENRLTDAVEEAIANPLLENRQIDGAKKILINITAKFIPLEDSREIVEEIKRTADKHALVKWGIIKDETMADDEVKITVIATGFDNAENSFDGKNDDSFVEENEPEDIFNMGDYESLVMGKTPVSSKPVTEPVTSNKFSALSLNSSVVERITEEHNRKENMTDDEVLNSPSGITSSGKSPMQTALDSISVPKNVDLKDENTPSIFRKLSNMSQNLSSSIDLV